MKDVVTPDTAVVTIDEQDYADRIRVEYQAFEDASRKALQHARHAGEMLAAVKRHMPHGTFTGWLEAHFPGSKRTAQRFMQIANNWSTIEANAPRVADLSLREAEKVIASPKRALAQDPDAESLDKFLADLYEKMRGPDRHRLHRGAWANAVYFRQTYYITKLAEADTEARGSTGRLAELETDVYTAVALCHLKFAQLAARISDPDDARWSELGIQRYQAVGIITVGDILGVTNETPFLDSSLIKREGEVRGEIAAVLMALELVDLDEVAAKLATDPAAPKGGAA